MHTHILVEAKNKTCSINLGYNGCYCTEKYVCWAIRVHGVSWIANTSVRCTPISAKCTDWLYALMCVCVCVCVRVNAYRRRRHRSTPYAIAAMQAKLEYCIPLHSSRSAFSGQHKQFNGNNADFPNENWSITHCHSPSLADEFHKIFIHSAFDWFFSVFFDSIFSNIQWHITYVFVYIIYVCSWRWKIWAAAYFELLFFSVR